MVRFCPCLENTEENDQYFLKYYTGVKNEVLYLISSNSDCKCSEKIATKEYKLFPVICKDCADARFSADNLEEIKGKPEKVSKWLNAYWIHQEFLLMTPIIKAVAIPNTDQYVAITGNYE